jgi:AcrR family transcriptional regulator
VLRTDATPSDGLRSRKKAKRRLAIQDAALDLFAEQGYDATTVEEIAARAEIGTTTFFSYFRSKSEPIVSDHNQWLPALQQAVVDAPLAVHDLDAIKHALQEQWITAIDLDRTVRQAQAIATSHVLRGISYDIGQVWLEAIADALARRHGFEVPDDRCWITARIALTILGHVMWSWMLDDCRGDLAVGVEKGFAVVTALQTERRELTDSTDPRTVEAGGMS